VQATPTSVLSSSVEPSQSLSMPSQYSWLAEPVTKGELAALAIWTIWASVSFTS
jgi:hypothetical protein